MVVTFEAKEDLKFANEILEIGVLGALTQVSAGSPQTGEMRKNVGFDYNGT